MAVPVQPRGYGFVHFGNEVEASKAQEAMHGKQLAGKHIVARIRNQGAHPPKSGSRFRANA